MHILANYMFIVECGFSMKIVSVHQEIKINFNFVAQNSGNNSLGSAMIKNPETDFHTASFPAGVQVLFSALFKRPVECLGLYWILELLWNLCASYALLHLNSPVSTCCVHPVILAISWNRLEDTLSHFCSYLDHIFLIFFLVKNLKESGSVARSGFHRETEAYQNHQLDLETRFKQGPSCPLHDKSHDMHMQSWHDKNKSGILQRKMIFLLLCGPETKYDIRE